jgi:ParB family chromosome partitioning protein
MQIGQLGHQKGAYVGGSNANSLAVKARKIRIKGRTEPVTVSLQTFKGCEDLEKHSAIPLQNFRIQELLTEDSLEDLADLKDTQTSPCLCYKGRDGLIYFIDGSRRRARAIMDDCPLDYELIKEELTDSEIESLVLTADNHKPISSYELGKYYSALLDKWKGTQKEFAGAKGLSESKLSRSLTAFKVPFPIYFAFTKRGLDLSVRDSLGYITALEAVKEAGQDIDQFFKELVEDVSKKNADADKDVFKKKVSQLLNRRVKKLKESEEQVTNKKAPEVIYTSDDGKVSVQLERTSKSNKVIKMRNVNEEQTSQITSLIDIALNHPEKLKRILSLIS